MTGNDKVRHDLIEECIKRGLPVTNNDSMETLKLYLKLADNIDKDEDHNDRIMFDEMEQERKKEKKNRSFLFRLFSF